MSANRDWLEVASLWGTQVRVMFDPMGEESIPIPKTHKKYLETPLFLVLTKAHSDAADDGVRPALATLHSTLQNASLRNAT